MPVNPQVFQLLFRHYAGLPHCLALGIRRESDHGGKPLMSVPWHADLIGNADTHTIHGGVITTLVDVTSASAVAARLPDFEVLATLDMRIDYMHPATPHERIYAQAECYRLAGQVAFVRSQCYQHDASDPIALGTATFMRTPLGNKEKSALSEYLHQEQSK